MQVKGLEGGGGGGQGRPCGGSFLGKIGPGEGAGPLDDSSVGGFKVKLRTDGAGLEPSGLASDEAGVWKLQSWLLRWPVSLP